MSTSTVNDIVIYPSFDGEGVRIDLYTDERAENCLGSAEFPLSHLVEEFLACYADENDTLSGIEEVEYAYALIDALRAAANKLAAAIEADE